MTAIDTATPAPGSWCRILSGGYVEHVEPCADHFKTGTVTHISDGKPVSEYVAEQARAGKFTTAWERSNRR